MPRRDLGRFWPALLIVVAGFALAVQIVLGRDLVGPFGLLVLLAPPLALATMLGAGRRAWPERLLVCLALAVALTVLAGILAALSPKGLDARSVAAVELGLLAAAIVVGIGPGADRARRRPGSTKGRAPAPLRALVGNASSIALVLGGVALAGVAYAMATQAANAQTAVGVVQFWSTPAAADRPAQVGMANRTADTLSCSVLITRRGHGTARVTISPLAPGQSWTSGLPPAEASETALWQLDLTCKGAPDQIQRRLLIDPPAPTAG
jgi:hypothetical protein